MASDERDIFEVIAPLLVLRDTIQSATALRPTAVMLPLSFLPGVEEAWGMHVVRGDRAALIFEPGVH